MSYPRLYVLLDLFGVLGILAAILYVVFGADVARQSPELAGLWGNIATEMIGIWLGVRLIDAILRRHEQTNLARIRAVRAMRFLLRQYKSAIEFSGRLEVEQLATEVRWTKGMIDKHHDRFKADEHADIEEFYSRLSSLLPGLRTLANLKDEVDAGLKERAELVSFRKQMWETVPSLNEARIQAEKNILTETQEEWV